MSESNEINVGLDFEQSKRLVLHWYRMYLKQGEEYYSREQQLQAENAKLKKIIAKELSENDEFGMEYTGIVLLKDENAKLKEQIQKADKLLNFITTNNWILLRKDLENLLGMISEARQALAQIREGK